MSSAHKNDAFKDATIQDRLDTDPGQVRSSCTTVSIVHPWNKSYVGTRRRTVKTVQVGQNQIHANRFSFIVGFTLASLLNSNAAEVRTNTVDVDELEDVRAGNGAGDEVDLDELEGVRGDNGVGEMVAGRSEDGVDEVEELDDVVAGGAEEDVKDLGDADNEIRRGVKRKFQEDPDHDLNKKPRKVMKLSQRLRFDRRVRVQWSHRILGRNRMRPYILSGSPFFRCLTVLKRPAQIVQPPLITRDEIDYMAQVAIFDEMPVMTNPRQRRGCSDTCGDKCNENCSCRLEGLPCAEHFGCPCDIFCDNLLRAAVTERELEERQREALESANQKTSHWVAREDSTISSEGTVDAREVVDLHNPTGYQDSVAMVGESGSDSTESIGEADTGMVEEGSEDGDDTLDIVKKQDVPDSPPQDSTESLDEADVALVEERSDDGNFDYQYPDSPVFDISASPPLPDNGNSTMKLSDDDDDLPPIPDSPRSVAHSNSSDVSSLGDPSDPSDPSDSEDSEDSEDEENDVTIDVDPAQFPKFMLNFIPAVLDEAEIETCNPGRWLGGEAVFVALLRVATKFNQQNEGRRIAVLHPNVYELARDVAENEDAEKQRRLLAGIKGQAPSLEVRPEIVSDRMIYGSGWTDLLVPMNVNHDHWVLTVVKRSLVQATIFDSLATPSGQDLNKAVIRKILESLGKMNREGKSTARFRIRYSPWRGVQADGVNCGIFVAFNARQALLNKNSSAYRSKEYTAREIRKERVAVQNELVGLLEMFERMERNNERWEHGRDGALRCYPAKTPVTLKYYGEGF